MESENQMAAAVFREVIDADAAFVAAKARLETARAAWLPMGCPFRIGQIVEVYGYPHRGKKMRVERISATDAPEQAAFPWPLAYSWARSEARWQRQRIHRQLRAVRVRIRSDPGVEHKRHWRYSSSYRRSVLCMRPQAWKASQAGGHP